MKYHELFDNIEDLNLVDFFLNYREENPEKPKPIDTTFIQERISDLRKYQGKDMANSIYGIVSHLMENKIRVKIAEKMKEDPEFKEAHASVHPDEEKELENNYIEGKTRKFLKENQKEFNQLIQTWIENHPYEVEKLRLQHKKSSDYSDWELEIEKLEYQQNLVKMDNIINEGRGMYSKPSIFKTAVTMNPLNLQSLLINHSLNKVKQIGIIQDSIDQFMERHPKIGNGIDFLINKL